MKVIYNWVKEFVDFDAAPTELRSRLSTSGTSIDSIEESAAGPVLDAELNANRPDCLGHYGIAREVAALYGAKLKAIEPKLSEASEPVSGAVKVSIEAPDLCQRFTARVVTGVKVQPSPDWLRQRLEAMGHASINNVVDISNYVMFELGQPLHTFDLDKLTSKEIAVRRARAGEEIRTLDGAKRTLTKDMCVVAAGGRAESIAGVMGGADSEIGFATRNVLIEAATWNPISVRHTSKALNLRSEASMRFERGTDIEMADVASRRAAELITQLFGGSVMHGMVDVYPTPQKAPEIEITSAEIVRVMGISVPDAEIERTLGALGFAPKRQNAGDAGATWVCTQPTWRRDVTREIDLIEEVARIYGYDKFAPRLPPAKTPAARQEHADAEDMLRQRLVGLGYQEIVSIPLVGRERDQMFRKQGATPAVIVNPLSEEADVMRGSGVVSMLTAMEWNLNHGQHSLRFFEIGRAYRLEGGKPAEARVLTLGATGWVREKNVEESAREIRFADLKGDLERVGEIAGGVEWKGTGPAWLAASDRAEVLCAEKVLGVAGKVGRKAAENFKLRQDIYVAEVELRPLLEAIDRASRTRKFEPLPRFPAVERDFSLLLPEGTKFAQVAEAIRDLDIAGLRNIEAVDLYRGKNVPGGKYSLLVRVTLQSSEATFTDAQLADFSAQIVSALEKRVGATLRTK